MFLAVMPEIAGAQHTFTVSANNLGHRKVIVSRSFGGIMMPLQQTIDFDADSLVCYRFGNDTPEHVLILVEGNDAKDATESLSLYTADASMLLTVDPKQGLLEVTGQTATQSAATKAAEAPYQLFIDYVTGVGDRLGLRDDTVAASAESKLMHFADSLATIIDKVPKPVRNALRQEMALNTLYLWNQLYFGWMNRRADKNTQEATAWKQADKNITAWAKLDNEANALSLLFDDIASSQWSKALTSSRMDSLRKLGKESIFFARFDHFARNYTGKNREDLLANLIYKDIKDAVFTEGVDSLFSIFRSMYPQSEITPILEEAVTKNMAINSTNELDPDIRFIEPTEGQALDSIIAMFKGKPVLVDVWATWCGPCRKSFEHADIIRDFARENGIELLYISIDEGSNREKAVRKLVKSYGLKGNHLIMPPSFKEDVYNRFGSNGYIIIPAIALYGSDGTLLESRFSESEDAPALIEAISTTLKTSGK